MCNAIGPKNIIQKQGLPIGASANFHALCRGFRPLVTNCETTCQSPLLGVSSMKLVPHVILVPLVI